MKTPTITFTTQSVDRLKYGNLECFGCGAKVQVRGESKKPFLAYIEPNLKWTDTRRSSKVHILCEDCVRESQIQEACERAHNIRKSWEGIV